MTLIDFLNTKTLELEDRVAEAVAWIAKDTPTGMTAESRATMRPVVAVRRDPTTALYTLVTSAPVVLFVAACNDQSNATFGPPPATFANTKTPSQDAMTDGPKSCTLNGCTAAGNSTGTRPTTGVPNAVNARKPGNSRMNVPTTALPLLKRTRSKELGPYLDDWKEQVAPNPMAAFVASLEASVARVQTPAEMSASTEMIWLQSTLLEPFTDHTGPENCTMTLDKSDVKFADITDTLPGCCSRMDTGITGMLEVGHWPWLFDALYGPPTEHTIPPGVPSYKLSLDVTVMTILAAWGLLSRMLSAKPRTVTGTGFGSEPLATNVTLDGWMSSCGQVTTAFEADAVHTSIVPFTAVTCVDANVIVTFLVGMLVKTSVIVSLNPISSTTRNGDDDDTVTQLQIDGHVPREHATTHSESLIQREVDAHCMREYPANNEEEGDASNTVALSASMTWPVHTNDEGNAVLYGGSRETVLTMLDVTAKGVEMAFATPSFTAETTTAVHKFQSEGEITNDDGW
jgi:hypothetical protein